jgi:S-adenosylmethionine:tRNA ribosyltransferase-isomerase
LYRLSDFDFDLPESVIALRPALPRHQARLLYIPACGDFQDRHVVDLWDYLRPEDCLVFNDTRVIKSFLTGRVTTLGRSAGFTATLLRMVAISDGVAWTALVRPAARLRVGDTVSFGDRLTATVTDKSHAGEVTFHTALSLPAFMEGLDSVGQMPLPPYIARRRAVDPQDDTDYQPLFAKHEGAVAAPTASLHFDEWMMEQLSSRGIGHQFVTLHVGAGTFLPVKTDDLTQHVMHSEWGCVSAEVAAHLTAVKARGGRVIAVGTTVLRILETAGLAPFAGETNIFITPSYKFRVVDALFTNFHLPKSTLFMLVSALGGVARLRAAYQHALAAHYRFFSYGDACFIESPI